MDAQNITINVARPAELCKACCTEDGVMVVTESMIAFAGWLPDAGDASMNGFRAAMYRGGERPSVTLIVDGD
jgi:hypothetical protein